jgi:hypothetical protein
VAIVVTVVTCGALYEVTGPIIAGAAGNLGAYSLASYDTSNNRSLVNDIAERAV